MITRQLKWWNSDKDYRLQFIALQSYDHGCAHHPWIASCPLAQRSCHLPTKHHHQQQGNLAGFFGALLTKPWLSFLEPMLGFQSTVSLFGRDLDIPAWHPWQDRANTSDALEAASSPAIADRGLNKTCTIGGVISWKLAAYQWIWYILSKEAWIG